MQQQQQQQQQAAAPAAAAAAARTVTAVSPAAAAATPVPAALLHLSFCCSSRLAERPSSCSGYCSQGVSLCLLMFPAAASFDDGEGAIGTAGGAGGDTPEAPTYVASTKGDCCCCCCCSSSNMLLVSPL